jgi:nucleoside-diphosphate-sugar epimerase
MREKVALIAGVGGIVGRAVFETMQQDPAWRVVGLSRRPVASITNMRHVAADLLDRGSIEAASDALRDTTPSSTPPITSAEPPSKRSHPISRCCAT